MRIDTGSNTRALMRGIDALREDARRAKEIEKEVASAQKQLDAALGALPDFAELRGYCDDADAYVAAYGAYQGAVAAKAKAAHVYAEWERRSKSPDVVFYGGNPPPEPADPNEIDVPPEPEPMTAKAKLKARAAVSAFLKAIEPVEVAARRLADLTAEKNALVVSMLSAGDGLAPGVQLVRDELAVDEQHEREDRAKKESEMRELEAQASENASRRKELRASLGMK